jgi:hypothetical protein
MRLTLALPVLLLFGACPLARAEADRHELRVELGTEYDSNPDRAETISDGTPILPRAGASPLARMVASAGWASAPGRFYGLALSGALAGKRFFNEEARGDDVLITQANGAGTVRVAPRLGLGAAVGYYDAFQRGPVDRRDFRSFTPTLRLEYGVGKISQLALGGGYRWFTFKSDDRLSFSGPTASLLFRQVLPGDLDTGGADWEWNAGALFEGRNFVGPACTNDTCTADSSTPGRQDRLWMGHIELTRTTSFLAGAGASVHYNPSNSTGESLVRGLFHLRGVVPLPWSFSLSGRADLVVTHYRNSLLLVKDPNAAAPLVSIEDENRSTLRFELSRPLAKGLEIGARVVFYSSFPSRGSVEYSRQTALLYLAVFDER